MARYSAAVGDALTVKAWQSALMVEALKRTRLASLMGMDRNSAVYVKDELEKGRGDTITYGLRMQDTSVGRGSTDIMEGNEQSLTIHTDSIVIETLKNAWRADSESSITQQRVPFSVRNELMDTAADWIANTLDTWFCNQVAGNTAETDVLLTGNQATVAPDSDHIVIAGGAANDQSLAAGNEFSLSLIDKAVERAETLSPAIRPVHLGNGVYRYVCLIHPYQKTDLRLNADEVGEWQNIQINAMRGGDLSQNPIFTGALGEYNNTIILPDNRMPNGVNSSTGASVANTKRASFLGAQAACMAFGQATKGGTAKWSEKFFDFDEQFGVQVKLHAGLKKTRFNSADFATIALPTYATQKS